MFDIGFSELVLLAVVALVVLGPEKLPHAARMAGAWLGRLRRAVIGIQAEIEKEVAAQEMRERIQKEIERLKESGQLVENETRAVENTIRASVTDTATDAHSHTPRTEAPREPSPPHPPQPPAAP